MSTKMSSKTKVRKTKETRKNDKFDEGMDNVKKIGIVSCCLIGILIVVSFFIDPNESYGAGFLQQLPDSFQSGMTTGNQTLIYDDNNEITLPKEFYGQTASGERLSYIYCMDRNKGMLGNKTYSKGVSVKDNVAIPGAESVYKTYPGLIYILQNDNLGGTSEENYYLTQLAVWWYIDRANGIDDNTNYSAYGVKVETPESSKTDKYDEYGNYKFYNNLSVLDKQTIKSNAKYGQKIVSLVEGAIANAANYPISGGSQDINIDNASITYNMTNDYIETSVIRPTSSNPNFESYSIQINDAVGNVQIVDENNNPLASTSISAGTGFKLRVPVSEVENSTFKANITVVGYFKDWYDAYIYNPEKNNVELQRALLGIIEKPSVSTSVNLEAPSINVPNTSKNSFLVYGIGALIIVAGIILIVVAKKPNNAKKK